ncbi:gephyrin-like molybdotransferase Glp [Pengzhenrongella sp.]|uniref:molybdopterin molybdotransferase MoeA n=1 Tax=Pengzhenrongella sp. TaxID=2888820 RepID=UPI002F938075
MRSVEDQLAAVLAAVSPVAPLDVVLADAVGCVLAADVASPRDVPEFALAALDGYAVASADTAGAGSGPGQGLTLPVVHDVAVGAPAPLRLAPGQAVRIASGAPLPLGADTVVPLEESGPSGLGTVHVLLTRHAKPGENVRRAGTDALGGEVVLTAGTRLGARQLALAAALGRGRLSVYPRPRVVVMSVGDELADAGSPARDGAVHDVNGPALTSAVTEAGAAAIRVAVAGDDRTALREAIEDQLVRADLLVTTGGLSESSQDTVKDVLRSFGTVRFDQVAMTPGTRQGFGRIGGAGAADGGGVPIFALPGNPVAAYLSFEVFVRPALRSMAGRPELLRPEVEAAATSGWASPAGLRQLVPVLLAGGPEEGYRCTPTGHPGELSSGALSKANAIAVVPEQTQEVHVEDRVRCLVLEG